MIRSRCRCGRVKAKANYACLKHKRKYPKARRGSEAWWERRREKVAA